MLRGPWDWTLFVLVWGLAVAGIVLRAVGGIRYPVISTCVYLAMGWLVLIAVKPLVFRVPPRSLFWLPAGGIAYTGGVVFFAAKRVPYGHFVWHLFVMAGTASHFIAVLWYAA